MDLGLSGRVALVAAATSGLGLGIARELAAEGAIVSVAGRSPDRLAAAVEELKAVSPTGTVGGVSLDVRDEEAVRAWADDVAAEHGRLDVVVTNAGGPGSGVASSHGVADYRAALELSLLSAVSLVSAGLPHLRRNGYGRVLFVTSQSVKQPIEGLALSNTVRPGLLGYAKSLVQEVSAEGITVNVLAPGMTRTPELEAWASTLPDGLAGLASDIPVGRVGETAELGALAAFLASPRAAFITGAVIPIDGGASRGLL
ncbi:SDR family NAD(P)-dependent oxidoreductase [Saccharothrix deserti]|uniref:SDR family NAD(P)-dependent oxidoreductase n=1 Tax=Saccharothrix deserti TaxID=2593674 RepID=UPI00192E323C|nr:SDR family oxidoreductase [Saccharothrix deserti]